MHIFDELKETDTLVKDDRTYRLAILGNCPAQPFIAAIRNKAESKGLMLEVLSIDTKASNFLFSDVASDITDFAPKAVFLWFSTEKLYDEFENWEDTQRSFFAEILINKIKRYWDNIRRKNHGIILQSNFAEIRNGKKVSYSCKNEESFIYQLRKLNYLLLEMMIEEENVYPVDVLMLQGQFGWENILPKLAEMVLDIWAIASGSNKKSDREKKNGE